MGTSYERLGLVLLCGALACDSGAGANAEEDGGAEASEADADDDGAMNDESGEGGGGFLVKTDVPSAIQCSVWEQDCPEGEKCIAYAQQGDDPWDATRCSPVPNDPQAAGSECHASEGRKGGVDDCDVGLMCWSVDEETNIGVCIQLCTGDSETPQCENPNASCKITNGGVLNLCQEDCDPLLQGCREGEGCYPVNNRFTCTQDRSFEGGGQAEPCSFLNGCDEGLFCTAAASVAGCPEGAPACCTNFCEVGDDSPCTDGAVCESFYEDDAAPPGLEKVGGCAVPT